MRVPSMLVLVLLLAAAPARAQLTGFPQGSVSPDQFYQSPDAGESDKGGSGQGFDTPDSDASGATNYTPPDSPYTSNSYNNTGEVCVTCSDDSSSGSDDSDSGGDDN